jgi:Zn-finger nucleic acid-binding protein
MNCPRCADGALDEREREGIVVDVCSSCRGVWLDRGELEKLIARASRDFDDLTARRDDKPPPAFHRDERDDGDYRRHPRKKRSVFESLGDIFD